MDIGCGNELYSNTLALEQEGWEGLLVDISPEAARNRKSKFINGDATTMKLPLPPYIDYLSLDIDEGTLLALKQLSLEETRFGVITIEHDAYRFGNQLRTEERDILIKAGYKLICDDVCGAVGAPFEDWFVTPGLEANAARFRASGKLYSDIIK